MREDIETINELRIEISQLVSGLRRAISFIEGVYDSGKPIPENEQVAGMLESLHAIADDGVRYVI